MAEFPSTAIFHCSYCLRWKSSDERSYEHIWPQSLGGDPLPAPWRTDDVCRQCNNIAGQWVDAEFVKSLYGSHERFSGTEAYLDPRNPAKAVVPLVFMGAVDNMDLEDDEVAEVWLGPAGDTIVHIRPRHEEAWDAFAGGKPTKKRSDGGFAYLLFASESQFWAHVTLGSFQRHFRFASRTLVNANMPDLTPALTAVDASDARQARHIGIARSFSGGIHTRMMVKVDVGSRFLAKLALGVGREVLGDAFLTSPYARTLSQALWERDFEKRQTIGVRGTGFFGGLGERLEPLPLAWPAGWVLMLATISGLPALTIVTPSGKAMTILVSDDPSLAAGADFGGEDGMTYLAIPAAGQAVGPIPLPDYLAFVTGVGVHPDLTRLKALQGDPNRLPAKR